MNFAKKQYRIYNNNCHYYNINSIICGKLFSGTHIFTRNTALDGPRVQKLEIERNPPVTCTFRKVKNRRSSYWIRLLVITILFAIKRSQFSRFNLILLNHRVVQSIKVFNTFLRKAGVYVHIFSRQTLKIRVLRYRWKTHGFFAHRRLKLARH